MRLIRILLAVDVCLKGQFSLILAFGKSLRQNQTLISQHQNSNISLIMSQVQYDIVKEDLKWVGM